MVNGIYFLRFYFVLLVTGSQMQCFPIAFGNFVISHNGKPSTLIILFGFDLKITSQNKKDFVLK